MNTRYRRLFRNQLKMATFDTDQLDSLRNLIRGEMDSALKPLFEKIEQSNAMTSQFMQKLKSLEDEVAEAKTEIESLKSIHKSDNVTVKSLSLGVQSLKSSLNELEQFSRNCNIELSGIPEATSENLTRILQSVATDIGYDKPLIIAKVHRVPSRAGNIRPIVCQFNLRSDRDEFIRLARGKRDLDIKSLCDSFISARYYVNDHLTRHNKYLLFKAKQYREENQDFKFVWCRDGKIFMRKNEKSKAIRIVEESDFSKLDV